MLSLCNNNNLLNFSSKSVKFLAKSPNLGSSSLTDQTISKNGDHGVQKFFTKRALITNMGSFPLYNPDSKPFFPRQIWVYWKLLKEEVKVLFFLFFF